MSQGSMKVSHGARKVSHGVRKVLHGARKVAHGARKVSHMAKNVYMVPGRCHMVPRRCHIVPGRCHIVPGKFQKVPGRSTVYFLPSRQLQNVMIVADSHDSCRHSRQLQVLKTAADCSDNCQQLQTKADVSVLVCLLRLSLTLMGGHMTMATTSCLPRKMFSFRTSSPFTVLIAADCRHALYLGMRNWFLIKS